ncbi:hypothetical protein ABVT39_025118 [Epinephelus coioides]
MAEEQEGVNYASVVFKANKHPPSEGKTEEIVYDEVKVQNETTDQAADGRRRHFKRLACGLGIISVILLAGIIAVCVYTIHNLTSLNNKLSSDNDDLRRNYNNLTQAISVLQNNWNELNVTRAQWSIDAYCPIRNNDRQCKACEKGWVHRQPNCHEINGAAWKTWEEAQEDCRGKNSDLVVLDDEAEKDLISHYSSPANDGYWVGLRVEDGTWRWINGSDLTESSWIVAATDGQCAVSVWTNLLSVSCDSRRRWFCKKKALSV